VHSDNHPRNTGIRHAVPKDNPRIVAGSKTTLKKLHIKYFFIS
jgi:hypothetical protein